MVARFQFSSMLNATLNKVELMTFPCLTRCFFVVGKNNQSASVKKKQKEKTIRLTIAMVQSPLEKEVVVNTIKGFVEIKAITQFENKKNIIHYLVLVRKPV